MTGSERFSERRDDQAVDRDDTAERRDIAADGRDVDAAFRDDRAVERDKDTRRDLAELDARLAAIGRQIADHLAEVERFDVDPGLPPEGVGRLRAVLAAHRRLVAGDREAVTGLISEVRLVLGHLLGDTVEASVDRHAAARDRRRSADDRTSSAGDRDLSAEDRSQSAVERAQAEPRDPDGGEYLPAERQDLLSTTAGALAASRRRIARAGDLLSHTARDPDPPPTEGSTHPTAPGRR